MGLVLPWRQPHVQRQLEGIVEHARKQLAQECARLLQAWIRIDLDQPRAHVFVYHEVVAQDLESVLLEVRVQSAVVDTLQRHQNDLENLIIIYFVEVNVQSFLSLQQFASLIETQLVALLEFSVVLVVLLHRVVGQVDEGLVDGLLAQGERVATGPDVALTEQVASLVLQVAAVDQYPQADVKLALVDKQRALNVFLYDEHLRLHVGTEVGTGGRGASELRRACASAV